MHPASTHSSAPGRGRTRSRRQSCPPTMPPLSPSTNNNTPYTPVNRQPEPANALQLFRLPSPQHLKEMEEQPLLVDRAVAMIQTSGSETDVHGQRGQHQQRRNVSIPAQSRLRDYSVHPYARPLSSETRTTSHVSSTTTTSRSHISSSACGSHQADAKAEEAPKLSSFDKLLQKVVRRARLLVVHDMVHTVGWLYSDISQAAFKVNMEDNFSDACSEGKKVFAWDERMYGGIISKGTIDLRSKLAKFAWPYTEKYFDSPPSTVRGNHAAEIDWMRRRMRIITKYDDMQSVPTCFLHESDKQGNVIWFGNRILRDFHVAFWYTRSESPIRSLKERYHTTPAPMLALSATAMLCAIHRVANGEGSCSATPNFEGSKYGPYYDVFFDAICRMRSDPNIGSEFRAQLQSLHNEGMKLLNAKYGGPGSSLKVPAVYIPSGVQVLTCQPTLVADEALPNLFTQPSWATDAPSSLALQLPPSAQVLPAASGPFVDYTSYDMSYQASSSAGHSQSSDLHFRDHRAGFPFTYFGDM